MKKLDKKFRKPEFQDYVALAGLNSADKFIKDLMNAESKKRDGERNDVGMFFGFLGRLLIIYGKSKLNEDLCTPIT